MEIIRTGVRQWADEDLANADVSRQVGRDIASTWYLNSGFLREMIMYEEDRFPCAETKKMLEALDKLDEISVDPASLTDVQIGQAYAIRINFIRDVVEQNFKAFAPDLLKYLPKIFCPIPF